MSFESKNESVLSVQLKVQELVVKLADTAVVSSSASNVTVDIQETIGEIRSAIFIDDSAGTAAPVTAANRTVSGTQVVLALSAPLATADAIVLKYVVQE